MGCKIHSGSDWECYQRFFWCIDLQFAEKGITDLPVMKLSADMVKYNLWLPGFYFRSVKMTQSFLWEKEWQSFTPTLLFKGCYWVSLNSLFLWLQGGEGFQGVPPWRHHRCQHNLHCQTHRSCSLQQRPAGHLEVSNGLEGWCEILCVSVHKFVQVHHVVIPVCCVCAFVCVYVHLWGLFMYAHSFTTLSWNNVCGCGQLFLFCRGTHWTPSSATWPCSWHLEKQLSSPGPMLSKAKPWSSTWVALPWMVTVLWTAPLKLPTAWGLCSHWRGRWGTSWCRSVFFALWQSDISTSEK